MIYHTAKRNSDSILAAVDASPNPPNEATVIVNAVSQLGGVAGDWEYTELSETQFLAQRAALPARSKLVAGVLSSATPISVGLSAGEVTADGLDAITLTVDCHDAAYNGAVTVRIYPFEVDAVTEVLTATAGVASDTISTQIEGVHRVEAETVLHGVGFASFEGV